MGYQWQYVGILRFSAGFSGVSVQMDMEASLKRDPKCTQVREAGELISTATYILGGGDTQIRKIDFSTMLIISCLAEKSRLPAEAVLPNRPFAAMASSPGAKDDSFNSFGKSKATEVNQGSLCSIKALHSSYKIQVYFDLCTPVGLTAGNNHGLAPKGEHRQ